MAEIDLNEIGARGLVVSDGKNGFKFVKENEWQGKGPLKDETETMQQLAKLRAVVARLDDNNVYADLDLLKELKESPEGIAVGQPRDLDKAPGRNVFLRHRGKVFQIPEKDWEDLDAGFEGAAGVVVNRGAIVSAVPPNPIPSGTYCVVIDLTSI